MSRFGSVRELVETLHPTEPLYCIRPQKLHQAAHNFVTGFPGKTLFAVKANPHPAIVGELYKAGIRCFDTASLHEIELVTGLFADAECYFMAPCKLMGTAQTAFDSFGVRHFVADHPSEVGRLLEFATPQTTVHIRMKAMDPASVYELSSKFGAEADETVVLLQQVAQAGCRAGLVFNVGSLCTHPDAYRRAIRAAGDVIKQSAVEIVSLDVGGGFPVSYPGLETAEVSEFFAAIKEETASINLPRECELLCEPGRALVATGQSLLTQVILMKDDLVFLNDGIYGALSELVISNGSVKFPLTVYRINGSPSHKTKPYSISGPTCDTLDIVPGKVDLPEDLKTGDWIEFGIAGAYSNSMASRFNGLHADQWMLIGDEDD